MIAPTEYACEPCGARARTWVTVADDALPLCRACAHRVSSDAAFRASLAATHSEPCEDVLPPLRASTPVVSPPLRASKPVVSPPPSRFHKAGAAVARRIATEPEFRQHFIELGRRLAAIRRRCLSCGLVSNRGGIGLHQRASGHTGYEEVQA